MRKVIVFNAITVDGFFEGPNHDISWHNVDEEFNDFSIAQLKKIDTILFGRKTYQMMASYWPTPDGVQDDPVVAELMNTTAKIVFSKSLNSADWQNTRLVTSDSSEEIARLKSDPGKDMIIFGSGDLVSSFANQGIIDEYRLLINPLILGTGKSLFENVIHQIDLELLETKSFHNGNVLLIYKPIKN